MKKEIIIAIILGFSVGLLITFGVYTAQKSIKEAGIIQSPLPDDQKTKPLSSSPEALPLLSLVSPLDESIAKESRISVIGTASPSAWILILTEKGEKIVQADQQGNFETEIILVSGENEIEIKSLGDKGDIVSKTVTVVYSTAEI